MTNIKCFDLYRGLNSVDLLVSFFYFHLYVNSRWWMACKEFDRSFNKQKIGENGMEIQEDWRQQLKINHHLQKELVDKISWELIMNELQVWRENDRLGFGATFVPALRQLNLQISKTCSVYTYRLCSRSKCICDLMYLECP